MKPLLRAGMLSYRLQAKVQIVGWRFPAIRPKPKLVWLLPLRTQTPKRAGQMTTPCQSLQDRQLMGLLAATTDSVKSIILEADAAEVVTKATTFGGAVIEDVVALEVTEAAKVAAIEVAVDIGETEEAKEGIAAEAEEGINVVARRADISNTSGNRMSRPAHSSGCTECPGKSG